MFKNSDRRNDLDKAYHHLIRVLFENIERLAEEHQKTPRAVIMMGKSSRDGTVRFFVSSMPYACTAYVVYFIISLYRLTYFLCFFFSQKTVIICLVSIELYKKN